MLEVWYERVTLEIGKTNISVIQRTAGQLWRHIEISGLDLSEITLNFFVFSSYVFWLSRVQNMWISRFNKGGPCQVNTIEDFGPYLEVPREPLKV